MNYIILLTFWHFDVLISVLYTLLEIKSVEYVFLYPLGGEQ
jgi:hypothetical protein